MTTMYTQSRPHAHEHSSYSGMLALYLNKYRKQQFVHNVNGNAYQKLQKTLHNYVFRVCYTTV